MNIALLLLLGVFFSALLLIPVDADQTEFVSIAAAESQITIPQNGNHTVSCTIPGGLNSENEYYMVKSGLFYVYGSMSPVNLHLMILNQGNYTKWQSSESFIEEYEEDRYFSGGGASGRGAFNTGHDEMGPIDITETYYLVFETDSEVLFTFQGLNLDEVTPKPDVPSFTILYAIIGLLFLLLYFKKQGFIVK